MGEMLLSQAAGCGPLLSQLPVMSDQHCDLEDTEHSLLSWQRRHECHGLPPSVFSGLLLSRASQPCPCLLPKVGACDL